MRTLQGSVGLCLVAVLATSPLTAQDIRPVDIHGFGGWSFGQTSVNRFLGADDDGEYSKTNFALKLTSTGIPAVQLNAQLFLRNGFDGSSTSLDYAFADWELNPALHVRVGKVKHPFGIYSEVAGLGTVRPFLNLPQVIYGPVAIASKSYRGVGLSGSVSLSNRWGLDYDLYGGGIEFEQEESALALISSAAADSAARVSDVLFESEAVIGGRLVIEAPVDGLRIGASAYSGRPESYTSPSSTLRYHVYAGQAEYVIDRTWVRGEIARQIDKIPGTDDRATSAYVEVAQFIGGNWQVAGQWSWFDVKVTLPPPATAPGDLTHHREWAMGVNYWVSPEFGLKSSIHWTEGNLFAELNQQDFLQVLFTRMSPQPRTRLLQFGAQFSF
ncbi:MAG: hypothetical protein R3E10_07050 [Gemmatimonadota bacterium]